MAVALDFATLREFLEEKHDLYNQPSFIALDPISIPHRYSRKEDIEVAGLISATLAWGRRDLIVRAADRITSMMGGSPFDYVMTAGDDHLAALDGFVYRTFQQVDAVSFVRALRKIYTEMGGLEQVLAPQLGEPDTFQAIMRYRQAALMADGFAARTEKHFANPSKGSSAKRLNMFLRWMVRQDRRGVDFGIWRNARAYQLICPLDVHTGTIARKLGILERNQNDWQAAIELTDVLRKMDPLDPVKYDFSLFGLGVNEHF